MGSVWTEGGVSVFRLHFPVGMYSLLTSVSGYDRNGVCVGSFSYFGASQCSSCECEAACIYVLVASAFTTIILLALSVVNNRAEAGAIVRAGIFHLRNEILVMMFLSVWWTPVRNFVSLPSFLAPPTFDACMGKWWLVQLSLPPRRYTNCCVVFPSLLSPL